MGKKGKPEIGQAMKPVLYKPWAKANDSTSMVRSIAESTGTNAVVFAAMKSAFGWTDLTLLTKSEFLAKRTAWLNSPASEG